MYEIPFILVSITGALLAGVSCSTVGILVVRMNIVSIGYCMSHAAFAGAALGIATNHNPLILATLFSIVVALILGFTAERIKLESNVIIGILFSLLIALAFIFLSIAPGEAASLHALSVLWGSLLTIDFNDVLILTFLTFLILLFFLLFYKELLSIMFNRKLAKASGINVRAFDFTILILVALTVSFSLKLVGGLLVFALIVNPASTAHQIFRDFRKIVIFSPVFGVASCLIGYALSFALDFPLGASVVVISSLMFAISVVFSKIY